MNGDLLNAWFESIVRTTRVSIHTTIRVIGEWRGLFASFPNYAYIEVIAEPSDDLRVDVEISEEKFKLRGCEDYIKQAVYGLLDVLCTDRRYAVLNIRLRIIDIKVHEIDSRGLAFRMAGRKAARKILEEDSWWYRNNLNGGSE